MMQRLSAALALAWVLALGAPAARAQNVVCPDAPAGDSSNKCANTRFVQGAGSTPTLLQNYIFVGSASNIANGVPMSGDCAVVSAGIVTCTKTNGVAFAASATTDTTNASNISSGSLALGRLSLATAHFYVGNGSGNPADVAMSGDCALSSAGLVTCTKTNGVAFAASATTDTTNAANITSGTLPAARLPAPSASTLGGVQSLTCSTSNWFRTLSTLGVFGCAQPAFSDLSGQLTAGTQISGQVPIANGGTNAATAPAARVSLNVESVTTFTNASYSATVADRVIATTANNFTAIRTVTLPPLSGYNPGQQVVVVDAGGAINGANTLLIAASGADTINGTASIVVSAQFGGAVLWPIGANKWGYIASAGGGGGGVSNVTPGNGLVSSVAAGCSQSAITASGTLSAAQCVNAQTGASYAIVDGDRAKLITATNAAAQAYTLAQAGAASQFVAGWYTDIVNLGSGAVTITPTTSTIKGQSSYQVLPGSSARITSDGTNYQVSGAGGSGASATPAAYGALCNAVAVASSSVSITSGAATLTALGASFTAADVGKVISVPNAGVTVSGVKGTLNTTISAFTDATHVTLAATASTTVSGVAETLVYFTDDTAAFNAIGGSASSLDMAGLSCGITSTVTFTKPTRWRGSGPNSVLYFRQTTGTTAKIGLQLAAGAAGISISGVYIDGDQGGQITATTAAGLVDGGGQALLLDSVDVNGNRDRQVKVTMPCLDDIAAGSRISNSSVHDCINISLHVVNGSHVWVTNNNFYRGPSIINATGIINVINPSGGGTDIHINDNRIDMSDLTGSTLNSGIWLGTNSGVNDGIEITGNVIVGVPGAVSNGAGILLTGVQSCAVHRNIIKYVTFGMSVATDRCAYTGNTLVGGATYAGIEMSGSLNAVVGNSVFADIYSTFGIVAGNCLSCTFSGNAIDATSAPNSFIGIQLYSSAGVPMSKNVVVSNVVTLPSAGTGTGIHILCAFSTSSCTRVTIANNIVSNGGVGSTGIWLNGNASATMSQALIGPNHLIQSTGVKIDAGWGLICYVTGQNSSTTALANSGAASACI